MKERRLGSAWLHKRTVCFRPISGVDASVHGSEVIENISTATGIHQLRRSRRTKAGQGLIFKPSQRKVRLGEPWHYDGQDIVSGWVQFDHLTIMTDPHAKW